MSINISGPFGRASLEHRRSMRAAGYLGTWLAAWAIGCSGSSAPGGDTGQGGSNVGGTSAVATGGTQSSPSTGGASQAATGGISASGGALATGGRQMATGGSPMQTGGSPPTGGAAPSGGAAPTGGTASTGGRSSTTPTGGATAIATGGTTATATGGTRATTSGGTSATPTGGRTSAGGNTSTGGSSASAGGSTAAGGAASSKGCGTQGMQTLLTGATAVSGGLSTSHRLKITSGGASHEYIIDIPANYSSTHPYRLIFSWYQAYGSDTGNATGLYPAFNGPNFDATNYAYFGLRREAMAANDPAIFVAPAGSGNMPWDFTRDSVLFDDILAQVDANLCIDDSRVFSTGFSFGAMMSYALSITRQTKLRAVVAMAAANYNLPGEPTDSNAAPIAYMGTVGMSDGTCPYVNSDANKTGGKWCAITHAQDNGCTIPATIPTTTVGSKKYVCYDFVGCKAGYPVKMCTFDGAHTPASVDDGTNTGDDGQKAFIPPLAWQFISQF